eukprot:GHVU01167981.1.p2 GENE.GHVU01167981.1~~GHVU01167981.1.p2  ORF type:complete len:221 (+),score=49.75 GHVU01167981.1:266-928(+)
MQHPRTPPRSSGPFARASQVGGRRREPVNLVKAKCVECEAEDPKYTFRCCKQQFCSTACYKAHTLPPAHGGGTGDDEAEPGKVEGCTSTSDVPNCGGTARRSTLEDTQRKRKRPHGDDDEDDDECLMLLSAAGIENLRKCGPLRRLLQKPELRAMLEEVDGSANRVAALAAVLQDPLLDVFTHVVMRALEEEDIPEDDESEAAMKTWLASVCEEAEDLSK